VIVVVGLALFILNQVRGSKAQEESHVEVWKLNLSGPPALVLVLVGVIIFAFPYTSLFRNPTDPSPPSTLPEQATTTTALGSPTTIVPEIGLPQTPINSTVAFDETCGEDVLSWEQPDIDSVAGWWISFEAYDLETDELFASFEIDTGFDDLTFGNNSVICELDFASDLALLYWIWIYPYNEVGFAEEPLFVEYLDES